LTYGKAQTTGNDKAQRDAFQHNKEWWGLYAVAGINISKIIKKYYEKVLQGVAKEDYYKEGLKAVRGLGITKFKAFQISVKNAYVAEKKKIDRIVITMSDIGISNNYYYQLYVSEWVSNMKYTPLTGDVIDLAVTGTDKAWNAYRRASIRKFGLPSNYQAKYGTLIEKLRNNRLKELELINNVLTNGIRSGASAQQMVKGILDVIGRRTVSTEGVEAVTGARANTVRIVRTESTRMLNAGRFAQSKYAESIGLKIQKQWDATLDSKTRTSHGNLDTKKVNLDTLFRIGNDSALYPGDFSLVKNNAYCRCHYFEIIDETSLDTRRGRDPITGEVKEISFTNFNDWAKNNNLTRSKTGLLVPNK
jgi:hypothetical protein